MNEPMQYASSMCFTVRIDGHPLGEFTKCEGLVADVELEEYSEGGNHSYIHRLPGRVKYENVILTRPLRSDSAELASWLGSMARVPMRTSAEITARSADGMPVCTWTLVDVIPVKWKGPTFDSGTPEPATESIELAHNGFIHRGVLGII